MRILMVTPMPPQEHAPGAIPVVLHAQLAGLTPRHSITLLTVAGLEPGEQEAVKSLRGQGVEVHAAMRTQPYGLQRWRRRWRLGSVWLRGKYPWRTVWFWEPELQNMVNRLLAEDRFDLVSVEDNAMGIYRYQTDLPKFITEHEVRRPRPIHWRAWTQAGILRWAFRELDWQRWRRYQTEIWRRFDRIQVFTERDAASIQQLAPKLNQRVRVNPFGVRIPAAPAPDAEIKGRVVFIGNFTHEPNVDAALWLGREIMPRLRKKVPGVSLTLIGIYPPEPIRALAGEDIAVTGAVPEVDPYLGSAAVILAPVRIGGGMRMKVLQAMAFGKAVVTTPRGIDGLAIAGQQPPVVVAKEAEEIAVVTADLLGNRQARQELGKRARAFVTENYSVQAYADRLERIFNELVSANRVSEERGVAACGVK